jgi:hypothetical protein
MVDFLPRMLASAMPNAEAAIDEVELVAPATSRAAQSGTFGEDFAFSYREIEPERPLVRGRAAAARRLLPFARRRAASCAGTTHCLAASKRHNPPAGSTQLPHRAVLILQGSVLIPQRTVVFLAGSVQLL